MGGWRLHWAAEAQAPGPKACMSWVPAQLLLERACSFSSTSCPHPEPGFGLDAGETREGNPAPACQHPVPTQ